MSKITLVEQASTPPPPASGRVTLYVKSDGNLYKQDDAAVEEQVGAGSSDGGGARVPCRAATAGADITLAAPQTIDGVSVIAGDRVLVKDQNDPEDNGVYVVAAGAWSRASDFDGAFVVSGTLVLVSEGTDNKDTVWQLITNAPITVGVTGLTFNPPSYRDLAFSADVESGTGTGSVGNSPRYATQDHSHAHGSGHTDPTSHAPSDGINAGFISGASQSKLNSADKKGLKDECRLSTDANITLSGNQIVDGSMTADGDRILVVAQTAPEENGIYIADSGAWSRSLDANQSSFWGQSTIVPVGFEGTDRAGVFFRGSVPDPLTFVLDTDALVFDEWGGTINLGTFGSNTADIIDGTNTGAIGTSNAFTASANHSHGHGNLAGGSHHAVAVASGAAGFLSGTDKAKLDGIGAGADVSSVTAGTGLTGGGTGAVTVNVIAHADGSIVVNANDVQVGVLATDAQHGNRGGGGIHSNATTSVAGFMSGTDKTKLDALVMSRIFIPAVATDDPNNSNWAVNAIAALQADSANAGLVHAAFDDTTEQGRGFEFEAPAGTTQMRFTFWVRAQSSPPATRTVGPKLYKRLIGVAAGGTAVSTWDSVTMSDFSFTTGIGTTWVAFQRTVLYTDFTLDMVIGNSYQFEFTRINPAAGTELTGNMNLKMIMVEFLV